MNNGAEYEQLIAILQDPDASLLNKHEAFTKLVRRFQDMVYGYAYGILGDLHLAEDAAQEAFISAYQNIGQLQNPGSFPGWLKQVALSQCSRLIRRRYGQIEALAAITYLFDQQPSPLATIEKQELQEEIRIALQTLPENQRLAMILYYINGYSQKEIAVFLDVSVVLVKKWLQRARQKMKERMIELMKDSLHKQRPSNDNRFIKTIHLAALMEAAKFDSQLETLELMLIDGFDPNDQSKEGQTLLHWAAQAGHAEVIEFLLKVGANPEIKDKSGKTPLQWAEEKGHQAAIKLLH